MRRTTQTAVIFASIAAAVATLGLALMPALVPTLVPAAAPHGDSTVLRTVELPRVVVSAPREPRVVELQRVVVHGERIVAPAASMAGLAQPLLAVLARQPN